jgi:phospholipid/cholesterol/gamma-HCH transport system substrate-binding protein
LQGDISTTISSVAVTSDEIGRLARQVNDLVGSNTEQFSRIISKIELTLDGLLAASENFGGLLEDEELILNLQESLRELPDTLRDTHTAVQDIQKVVQSADRNLQNLEGLTRPLGERGEQLVIRVDSTVAKLDTLVGELAEFTRMLSSSQGSLGQFVNNPDLYHNLNDAVANVERITRELRPIIRDARVFSDKIARHPEQLGVRGAIDQSSGIK